MLCKDKPDRNTSDMKLIGKGFMLGFDVMCPRSHELDLSFGIPLNMFLKNKK